MKKKLFVIVTAVAMSAMLAACGGGSIKRVFSFQWRE